MYLDNELVIADMTDIWWEENWKHGDVRTIKANLKPGRHGLVVYGGEGCCDGK